MPDKQVDKQLDNRLYTSGTEVGLFNLDADAGVQVRDDGCVEIFAGSTSILVDGQSGTVTINGQTINNVAKRINNRSDELFVGGGQLNQKWLPTAEEIASSSVSDALVNNPTLSPLCLDRSPLVALPAGLDTPLVAGIPQTGQYPITLRSLTKAVPMFRAKSGALRMLKVIDGINFEDM